MSNESTITLEVNGRDYTGWESFSAEFDMESLLSTFELTLSDQTGAFTRAFRAGLACKISVSHPVKGSSLLIDGFVTRTNKTLGSTSDTLVVEGSDKLVDFVDCSAIYKSQTWTYKRFSAIVSDLLAPFGLRSDPRELTSNPVIERFTIQSGETAFSACERLCRSQAVLPLSTPEGYLLLGYAADQTGKAAVGLEVGVNIEDLSETVDWSERFSNYTALAQYPGKGKRWTQDMLRSQSEAIDAGVNRYRPKLFIAETKAEKRGLDKRVRWEAQVRSGRARVHTVGVSGWWQKTALGDPIRLWVKNERVNLRYPRWDLDHERLVTKVNMTLDEAGERAELTLKHPSIFAPDPFEEVDLT